MNYLERIQHLTNVQLVDPEESKYTIFAHTGEELGELARAICIEDNSRLKKHKTLDEPAKAEALDLLICAASMYFATGGDMADIETIINSKLDKWENTFKKNEQID